MFLNHHLGKHTSNYLKKNCQTFRVAMSDKSCLEVHFFTQVDLNIVNLQEINNHCRKTLDKKVIELFIVSASQYDFVEQKAKRK